MNQTGMMAAGIPGAAAVVGSVVTGIAAAGSASTDATAIGADINVLATTAASTGVILPSRQVGDDVLVYNGGASTLTVYPPLLGQINALTVSTGGFAVATLLSARFVKVTSTRWVAMLSA